MKRENIADRGIWTAKNLDTFSTHDSEGVRYAEPKLKIMGIEGPSEVRLLHLVDKSIKDALKVVMKGTEDEMIDFIENFRKEFKSLPPEDISFPRSVSEVTKYKSNSASMRKELRFIVVVLYSSITM